jgi:hypothetical protein
MPQRVVLTFPPVRGSPPLAESPALVERAAAALGRTAGEIAAARPRRLSFDARRGKRLWRVELEVFGGGRERSPGAGHDAADLRRSGRGRAARGHHRVGAGRALRRPRPPGRGFHVTVLERGRDAQTRRRPIADLNRGLPADPDSNYCFGEGGAGTYSDGKLYTRSGDAGSVRGVLQHLVAHGAPPEILVSWRPHVGSNRLPKVVTALRETLERSGGQMLFGRAPRSCARAPTATRGASRPSSTATSTRARPAAWSATR